MTTKTIPNIVQAVEAIHRKKGISTWLQETEIPPGPLEYWHLQKKWTEQKFGPFFSEIPILERYFEIN